MTDQAINVAIAEAVGWKSRGPDYWVHERFDSRDEPPDFVNDLNAMHEAETSVLVSDHSCVLHWKFCDELQNIVPAIHGHLTMVSATARQRAEAFLRTCGLWRDQ